VAVGVAAMLLNLGFSLLFSALFTGWGLPPHGGLALANSLATFLEMVGLLYLMRRRLNGLGGGSVWRAALQAGLASAGMGLAVWAWLDLTAGRSDALVALAGIALGGAAYGLLLLALGNREARMALGMLWRK
jgi:putative peptidoglycan lipid II flippase